MHTACDTVRRFFEEYERRRASSEPAAIGPLYNESFLFAGPRGAQAVTRDAFLKALPRYASVLQAAGLRSSTIGAIEEFPLDDQHLLVRASWTMRFQRRAGAAPIDEGTSATYVLRRQGDRLSIVLQLDHQDLAQRVQELGLVAPAAAG